MINKYMQKESSYILDDILVMQYTPKNLKADIISRPRSSFLYVESGIYKYTYNNNTIYVNSGEIVYLPKDSGYTYEVLDQKSKCIQIEFELKNYKDGRFEDICFSEFPARIEQNTEIISDLFRSLTGSFLKDSFLTLSLMYKIIALSFNEKKSAYDSVNSDIKRIRPAIDYIEKNFCKKISVPELAQMCGVSESHLRRLFKECLGVSPVKFKKNIVLEYACDLLKSGTINVSEAADILGFSDIYSFSQMFKKGMGVSPKKYIKIYG